MRVVAIIPILVCALAATVSALPQNAADSVAKVPCKECGHDGKGCDIVKRTRDYIKLDGRPYSADPNRFFYEHHAMKGSRDMGIAFVADLSNKDGGKQTFELTSDGPWNDGDAADWPTKDNQRTLWAVTVGPKTRYFTMNGWAKCTGVWSHGEAFGMKNTVVFVYHY